MLNKIALTLSVRSTTFSGDIIFAHTMNNIMDLTIRQARAEDTPTIIRFNALMAEETEHRTLDPDTLRKGVEAVLADPAKGIYFVATLAGRIVGQLMITYEWSDWRNGNFWWIQSVYIEKEHRGKGVYRMLSAYVTNMASARKDVCGFRLYVDKDNARAKQTYEALGMHKTPYELYEIDFVL